MRGRMLAVVMTAGLGLTAFAVTAGPLDAGNGPLFQLIVTKEVVGNQTEPGPFEIMVTCNPIDDGPVPEGNTVDLELDGGESEAVSVFFGETCTVVEIEDRGATSVTYACDPIAFTTCNADNEVTFDGSDNTGTAEITVTNTFEEPPPTTTTTTPPPRPEPRPLVIEPAFTG